MGLTHMQTRIISGAFDLKETTIGQLVTPMHRVFALSIDSVLDEATIELIKTKGYSRVPVYYGENKSFIIGVLIVKSLIGLPIQPERTLRELSFQGLCSIQTPLYASPEAKVGSMLNIFKKGTAHLAIVVEDPQTIDRDTQAILQAMHRGEDMQLAASFRHGVIGITTLEKIVE